ncbi:MAG: hypothetical protein H6870_08150 [Methylobacteriaceae bacterium]|nr:hypothetical protein [Methylobacteriaceae bacterium]
MAEPEAAKTAHDQQTDAAAGPSGDAALKAIAHLQEVAESLAADAAKLAADEPAKNEHAKAEADPDKLERRILLPALFVARDESKPQPEARPPRSSGGRRRATISAQVVWAQTAAAAFADDGGRRRRLSRLMDYLDRQETQRLAAEDALRKSRGNAGGTRIARQDRQPHA